MKDKLIIKGARDHNLKNVSITSPKNKLVVVTGLSGSGKSREVYTDAEIKQLLERDRLSMRLRRNLDRMLASVNTVIDNDRPVC